MPSVTDVAIDHDHLAQLVEHHEVSAPWHPHLGEEAKAAIVSSCLERARDWCTAHSVEANLCQFERVTAGDERAIGVRWSVTVGHGTSAVAGTTWNEVAARMHWTWSDRWQHWRGWFASMAAVADAHARAQAGLEGGGALVLSLPDKRPTWAGGTDGPHSAACDGEPHPGQACPVDWP
ncbi:hypothetical protein SEA_RHINOFORTE_67 [Mycobacterium phage Rhinoforte]|uniref:Uncharacterized protein n=1 Tax=Mycobacterium phage Rhinoforte TaxID=2599878 RepID=A0A5J6TT67_9CAUD|nr:hypothetical protein SEA_RHINOFORTE_67 [Mycobacterium phage Rhinoforte]